MVEGRHHATRARAEWRRAVRCARCPGVATEFARAGPSPKLIVGTGLWWAGERGFACGGLANGGFANRQVLNLSYNRVTYLPENISALMMLKQLLLGHNELVEVTTGDRAHAWCDETPMLSRQPRQSERAVRGSNGGTGMDTRDDVLVTPSRSHRGAAHTRSSRARLARPLGDASAGAHHRRATTAASTPPPRARPLLRRFAAGPSYPSPPAPRRPPARPPARQLPDGLCKLPNLRELRLECNKLAHLPLTIGSLVGLEVRLGSPHVLARADRTLSRRVPSTRGARASAREGRGEGVARAVRAGARATRRCARGRRRTTTTSPMGNGEQGRRDARDDERG